MKKLYFLFAFIITLAVSCGGGDDGGSVDNTQPPENASLLFPVNNEECTQGVEVNETHTAVTFQWQEGAHANYYQLVIKNLLSGAVVKYTVPATAYEARLEKDTPYSWYVVSRRDGAQLSAQSETWKFYNAGSGMVSHPPFPAEGITPGSGANINTTTVTLEWEGSDVDNDIVHYEVYLDTASPPSVLLESGLTGASINDIPVLSGATYYWQVITFDAEGNTSQSEIFQFKVN